MPTDPAEHSLRRALIRLQAFGLETDGAMRLGCPDDALRFVHGRVAATMLARRLLFLWDDVPRLTCDASGCRLLRFALSGADGIPGETRDCHDPADPDGAAAALARTIRDVGRGASRIAVTSAPLTDLVDPALVGLPATTLETAFGLSEPIAGAVQDFLDAAGDVLTSAAELREDMLYAMIGSDTAVEALVERAERDLPGIETVLTGDAGGSALLMISGAGATRIFAQTKDTLLVADALPGAEPALAHAWQSHLPR